MNKKNKRNTLKSDADFSSLMSCPMFHFNWFLYTGSARQFSCQQTLFSLCRCIKFEKPIESPGGNQYLINILCCSPDHQFVQAWGFLITIITLIWKSSPVTQFWKLPVNRSIVQRSEKPNNRFLIKIWSADNIV